MNTVEHKFKKENRIDTELRNLWISICNENREALSNVYHLMYPKLLAFGLKQVGSKELIKDSIQDLFLNIWEHRKNLSSVHNVESYLYLSLKHKIFENLKRQKSIDHRNRSYIDNTLDNKDDNQETLIYSDQFINILRNYIHVLNKLTYRQKQIIYLKYYEGLSTNEISYTLNIRTQSVYNYLHESMKKIRSIYN